MQDDESAVSHTRLAYLPALDGVRACAVLAVMMFHGGIPHMDGGFMGVDAFFVLSGFLITSLLIGEWRQSADHQARCLLGPAGAAAPAGAAPDAALRGLLRVRDRAQEAPTGPCGSTRWPRCSTSATGTSSSSTPTTSTRRRPPPRCCTPGRSRSRSSSTSSGRSWFSESCTSLRACGPCSHCAAPRRSPRPPGCTCVYDGGLNTNRAYLGTDTRSQCLFIGCALAVGLVLLTQRSHEEGRLAKGELWRPRATPATLACGVAGVVGAAGAVGLWVLTTSTSSFPYSGGFFLIGLCRGGRHPRRGRRAAQHRAPRALAGAGALRGPHLLRALHLALADLHLARPFPDWPLRLRALRPARPRHVRRVGRVLPPGRATDPHGHLRQPVAGLAGRARRRGRRPGRHRRRHHRDDRGREHGLGHAGDQVDVSATTSTRGPVPPRPRVAGAGPALRRLGGADARDRVWRARRSRTSTATSSSDKGILGCGVVDGPEVELMGARDITPPACDGSPLAPGEPLRPAALAHPVG